MCIGDRARRIVDLRCTLSIQFWVWSTGCPDALSSAVVPEEPLGPIPPMDGWVDPWQALAERAAILRTRNAELMGEGAADHEEANLLPAAAASVMG